jgi:hypothetical protein
MNACRAWRGKRLTTAFAASGRRLAFVLKPRRIIRVADQRMADMGHVHADLMGAAGFEPAFDHGGERRGIRLFEKRSTT